MVQREYWLKLLEAAWTQKPIVWLSGVRRVGKTFLCQSVPQIEYFDCELPRVRRQMEDPEGFLSRLKGKRIVLDEIHRLPNPSEFLKIIADHFPSIKAIATGSSTLQASSRFRDTLAGRKTQVWLTPMMSQDLIDFGKPDLRHRFLRGGLPPFFLSQEFPRGRFSGVDRFLLGEGYPGTLPAGATTFLSKADGIALYPEWRNLRGNPICRAMRSQPGHHQQLSRRAGGHVDHPCDPSLFHTPLRRNHLGA